MKYRRHFAQAPEGFFVFSKGMEKRADLTAWVNHFFRKDILTCIVQDEEGLYYLCREGVEETSKPLRRKRRDYVTHLKGEKK